MFGLSMIKPQQNRHRHHKTATDRVQQYTARYKKKNRKPIAVQGLPALSYNNLQQRRKSVRFLVRMRSPVQIWLAAPKSSRPNRDGCFFVADTF